MSSPLAEKPPAHCGYFGTHPTCFGALHRPAAPTNQGAIIVNDFGNRGMCAYWTFRHLAELLAGAGNTVLRFDLPGTGDSPALSDNRVEVWQMSVREAIEHLRAHDGIEQLTLIGFGIGALLAFNEAQRQTMVKSVVLIQPFVSGERYLTTLEPDSRRGLELASGRTFSKHFLAAAEEQSLRALAATFQPRVPQLDTNIVSFNGDSREFEQQMDRAGAPYRVHPSPDGSRWMQEPGNVIPDFFSGIADRLQRQGPVPHAVKEVPLRARHAAPRVGYEEESVTCATNYGNFLHGVVTTPAATPWPRALVIFFGTAAQRRTGTHDNNTYWARSLAERGIATLRFDASGFGDSSPRPGCRDNEMLVERNFTDAAPLLTEMRRRSFAEFGSLGLSSGGYNALKFAMNNDGFVGVFGINIPRFVIRQSFDQAMRSQIKRTNAYWTGLRHRETWSRLFRGKVHARLIAAELSRRLKARTRTQLGLLLGRLRGKAQVDLGQAHQEMVAFLGRPRTAVHLAYALKDNVMEEFEHEFGPGGVVLRDWRNFQMTVLPELDHSVSSPADAAQVAALAGAFFARVFSGSKAQ